MEDWLDRERLWCIDCGHKWILSSNKMITRQQHDIWVRAVIKHHTQIKKESEEQDV